MARKANEAGTARRIAVVTGATEGMGLEITRQLVAAGFHVVLGARNAAKGEVVAATLRAAGGSAEPAALDVTDPAEVQAAADRVRRRLGMVDVLVNNAGVSLDHRRDPPDTTRDEYRRTYETNVFGVATTTNAFLPLLVQSPDARIINQSAILGVGRLVAAMQPPLVDLRMTAYASSKAALNSLTLEYAKFLRHSSVKVYATSPGQVATALNNFQSGGLTAAEGATVAVDLAVRSDPRPTGTLWGRQGQIPW